jgi:hypothetical protein
MPSKAPHKAAAFSKVLAGCETTNPRYAELLKSWQQHPDKDKLWQAVQVAAQADHRSPPTAPDFIGAVLSSTISVKILNDHNDRVLAAFQKLKRKITGVVTDADDPFALWRDLQGFERPLLDLSRSAFDLRTRAGGRKDQDGSRDRKAFVHRVFHYVHSTCGQYLPTDVATMVDIFFPGIEDTERQVRKWLPPKPRKRNV